jgi:hypothetical protein
VELNYCDPKAFNALLRLRRERRINWRAVVLGQVISSFVNRETGEAWPSRAMLATITGIKESDISSVVHELRDIGFFTIEERDGRSNVYHLTPPRNATHPSPFDLETPPRSTTHNNK